MRVPVHDAAAPAVRGGRSDSSRVLRRGWARRVGAARAHDEQYAVGPSRQPQPCHGRAGCVPGVRRAVACRAWRSLRRRHAGYLRRAVQRQPPQRERLAARMRADGLAGGRGAHECPVRRAGRVRVDDGGASSAFHCCSAGFPRSSSAAAAWTLRTRPRARLCEIAAGTPEVLGRRPAGPTCTWARVVTSYFGRGWGRTLPMRSDTSARSTAPRGRTAAAAGSAGGAGGGRFASEEPTKRRHGRARREWLEPGIEALSRWLEHR